MARFAIWSSICFSTIGIILIAACIATNNWVIRGRATFEAKEGLFYRCTKNTNADGVVTESCERIFNDFKDFSALYIAILTLMFGACLIQLINLMVSFISYCMDLQPKTVICTLESLTIMSAIGGLATYVRFYDNKYYRLDWSYILGWVGVFFVSIGLIFIIVGIERKKRFPY